MPRRAKGSIILYDTWNERILIHLLRVKEDYTARMTATLNHNEFVNPLASALSALVRHGFVIRSRYEPGTGAPKVFYALTEKGREEAENLKLLRSQNVFNLEKYLYGKVFG